MINCTSVKYDQTMIECICAYHLCIQAYFHCQDFLFLGGSWVLCSLSTSD